MERLSAGRMHRLLQTTAEAAEFADLAAFRVGVLALVRRLVTYDKASYNEIRLGEGAFVIADPAAELTDENERLFGQLAGQNPLVAHYARTGDGQPARFSDFITRHQLHRLELYDAVYRDLGIEYQLAFALPAPPGEVIGISLNRERRDFSGPEAAMMALLRAPLRAIYLRLLELERLQRLQAALDGTSGGTTRAAALVDDRGTIVRATPTAEMLLDAGVGAPVPEALRGWLAHARADAGAPADGGPPPRLLFRHQGQRLCAQLSARVPGAPYAITLTIQRETPGCAELRMLGLSARQAEILQALADGSTNAQMARRLGLSPRTVEKHLEHVYAHLGVTTRAAAVQSAFTLAQADG